MAPLNGITNEGPSSVLNRPVGKHPSVAEGIWEKIPQKTRSVLLRDEDAICEAVADHAGLAGCRAKHLKTLSLKARKAPDFESFASDYVQHLSQAGIENAHTEKITSLLLDSKGFRSALEKIDYSPRVDLHKDGLKALFLFYRRHVQR